MRSLLLGRTSLRHRRLAFPRHGRTLGLCSRGGCGSSLADTGLPTGPNRLRRLSQYFSRRRISLTACRDRIDARERRRWKLVAALRPSGVPGKRPFGGLVALPQSYLRQFRNSAQHRWPLHIYGKIYTVSRLPPSAKVKRHGLSFVSDRQVGNALPENGRAQASWSWPNPLCEKCGLDDHNLWHACRR
jgi:hypothetical protein